MKWHMHHKEELKRRRPYTNVG